MEAAAEADFTPSQLPGAFYALLAATCVNICAATGVGVARRTRFPFDMREFWLVMVIVLSIGLQSIFMLLRALIPINCGWVLLCEVVVQFAAVNACMLRALRLWVLYFAAQERLAALRRLDKQHRTREVVTRTPSLTNNGAARKRVTRTRSLTSIGRARTSITRAHTASLTYDGAARSRSNSGATTSTSRTRRQSSEISGSNRYKISRAKTQVDSSRSASVPEQVLLGELRMSRDLSGRTVKLSSRARKQCRRLGSDTFGPLAEDSKTQGQPPIPENGDAVATADARHLVKMQNETDNGSTGNEVGKNDETTQPQTKRKRSESAATTTARETSSSQVVSSSSTRSLESGDNVAAQTAAQRPRELSRETSRCKSLVVATPWFTRHRHWVASWNLAIAFAIATWVECVIVLVQYLVLNPEELFENDPQCPSLFVTRWILSFCEVLTGAGLMVTGWKIRKARDGSHLRDEFKYLIIAAVFIVPVLFVHGRGGFDHPFFITNFCVPLGYQIFTGILIYYPAYCGWRMESSKAKRRSRKKHSKKARKDSAAHSKKLKREKSSRSASCSYASTSRGSSSSLKLIDLVTRPEYAAELKSFERHLARELCVENMMAYKAIRQFEKLDHASMSDSQLAAQALEIFMRYVRSGAHNETNMDHITRGQILKILHECIPKFDPRARSVNFFIADVQKLGFLITSGRVPPTMYTPLKEHVFKLMAGDPFYRWTIAVEEEGANSSDEGKEKGSPFFAI